MAKIEFSDGAFGNNVTQVDLTNFDIASGERLVVLTASNNATTLSQVNWGTDTDILTQISDADNPQDNPGLGELEAGQATGLTPAIRTLEIVFSASGRHLVSAYAISGSDAPNGDTDLLARQTAVPYHATGVQV